MNWIEVDSEDKISEIKSLSNAGRVLVFIYNSSSSVDFIVRLLFEREWHDAAMRMKTYFVDTVHHHKLFENLAKEFGVDQISPKILIIEKGKCVFDAINGKAQVINLKQFAN